MEWWRPTLSYDGQDIVQGQLNEVEVGRLIRLTKPLIFITSPLPAINDGMANSDGRDTVYTVSSYTYGVSGSCVTSNSAAREEPVAPLLVVEWSSVRRSCRQQGLETDPSHSGSCHWTEDAPNQSAIIKASAALPVRTGGGCGFSAILHIGPARHSVSMLLPPKSITRLSCGDICVGLCYKVVTRTQVLCYVNEVRKISNPCRVADASPGVRHFGQSYVE